MFQQPNDQIDYNCLNLFADKKRKEIKIGPEKMSEKETKPVEHLVVDSSAFIRNAPIKDLTDTAYAVHGLVDEIKDANTRASLQVLPYDLKFREPNTEAIKFGINFLLIKLLDPPKSTFNSFFSQSIRQKDGRLL